MTPQEVIQEGNKRLKEIFAKHIEFQKIEEKIQLTQDVTSVDVETISSAMSMMSAYLSSLVRVISKYTSLANSQNIYRKFSMMWEFNSSPFKLKYEKDNDALDKNEKEYFEELINKYVADVLKSKYEAYERHVSILQSRSGILKNEMFRNT